MLGRKKTVINPNITDTLIGEGSLFEGRIRSEAIIEEGGVSWAAARWSQKPPIRDPVQRSLRMTTETNRSPHPKAALTAIPSCFRFPPVYSIQLPAA
jgi:hypothetical protein